MTIIQTDDFGPCDTRFGFYTVGSKNFYHKYNACVYTKGTNQPVDWNFEENIFKEQAKKPRMNVQLLDLYKLRAEQLRDTYDYIILAYTGGSDSDNILKAFIDNGIPLDEVWTDHHGDVVEKSGYQLNLSLANTNLVSEHFLVTKPELEKLKISNPEIKIHSSDSCTELTIEDTYDLWSYLNVPVSYHVHKRYKYISQYVAKLSEKQKVCVIIGSEKVIPYLNENNYGFLFTDNATLMKSSFMEYFYWTPDMPEIVTEQAHLVWDFLKANPKILHSKMLLQKLNSSAWMLRSASFDKIIKSLIYPKWDFAKHQTNKQGILINHSYHYFFKNHSQEMFYQAWQSNWLEAMDSVDPVTFFKNGQDFKNDVRSHLNAHVIGTL
jgi:hypothetical protein